MTTVAAVGSNEPSAVRGVRRHSVEIPSALSSVTPNHHYNQQQHNNAIGGIHSSISVSSLSNYNGNNNVVHHVGHSRGRPQLLDIDVLEEGRSQTGQSPGNAARQYQGFSGRWQSSASSAKPMSALQLPATIDANSVRRRSDGNLPTTTAPSSITTTISSATSRRNSSPRPGRRSGVVATNVATVDDLLRSTSYEEELEMRLEHVRLRAVDADRRLAAERLRRRQATQRMAELEQQHVEVVSRLAAEADRKNDRLKARYEEVKENCRRRLVDASAKVERLETRLRKVEAELTKALEQQQRYRNCRIIDPHKLRDTATQVDDLDVIGNCQQEIDSSLLPKTVLAAQTKPANGATDLVDLVDGVIAASVSDEKAAQPSQPNLMWYRLYEMVTALALSRVRYLEELVSAGNRRPRQSEADLQLRKLQVSRRRVVGVPGDSARLLKRVNKEPEAPVQSPVKGIDERAEMSDDDRSQTTSSSGTTLRRTSSCPVPDMFGCKEMNGIGADNGSKENRRSDDVTRSQSADELCDVSGTVNYRAATAKTLLSPDSQKKDFFNLSTMTVSELCDSAFSSIRMSPGADDLTDIDDDFRSSSSIATEAAFSSSPVSRKTVSTTGDGSSADSMMSPKVQESKAAKRHTSLHLDIFRKLQNGVTLRRRERVTQGTSSSSRTTSMISTGSDDDRSDSGVASWKSLPTRHSLYSSSNDISYATSLANRGVTGGGPLRAVHSPGSASSSMADSTVLPQTPPPFDSSASHQPLLRRSLPLSSRHRSRGSVSTLTANYSASADAEVELKQSTEQREAVGQKAADDDQEVVQSTSVSSSGFRQMAGQNGNRPKSSSFGRLHERRNGLTAATVEFRSSTTTTTTTATTTTSGLLPNRRPSSQSRLDSLARNIRSYLTNQ